ncbi:MAG: hypothetical protein WDM80_02160 [Limisphaerales bacterium]
MQPVHHQVTHTLTIRTNAPGIKAGALVRVWMPYAQEYRQQRDLKLISASPRTDAHRAERCGWQSRWRRAAADDLF